MEHITVGKVHNKGKIAFVECVKNPDLADVHIKGKSFLLMILTEGTVCFRVNGEITVAVAPSFVCFNESEDPVFLSQTGAKYTCVYFHPRFLNVNMTFELLRSKQYSDLAMTHDMFMLKPFVDGVCVVPISNTLVESISDSADFMLEELSNQRDWYWSCRGRSYFMEILILLERMYGLIGYGYDHQGEDNAALVSSPRLRDAILYIEGNYNRGISLSDIASSAGVNHTTLTELMKKEFGCTARGYLMKYRTNIAKKQLAFTEVPIKDIADRTGFKTVQHFSRIFKQYTGMSPAEFRKTAVRERKEKFK